MVICIFIAIIGALLGSFLNVYIHRTIVRERDGRPENVASPRRSYCPHCRTSIAWYDNIPLLSFVWLKGRCRHCAQKISWRYCVVEVLMSGLTVFLYHLFVVQRENMGGFVVAVLITAALVALTFIDIAVMIIPNELTLGGCVLGLVLSAAWPAWHGVVDTGSVLINHWLGLRAALIGLAVGGGGLYVIGYLGSKAFGKDAMGGGDVKLLAMLGAFLGWAAMGFIIFFASLIGTIVMSVSLVRGRKGWGDEIPFGPFLAAGAFLTLCWQDIFINLFCKGIWP